VLKKVVGATVEPENGRGTASGLSFHSPLDVDHEI
jgi:hypothetical protein